MSMRNVLDTTLAAMEDPTIGLAAQVAILIAGGAPAIATSFVFGKWAIKTGLRDARGHSIIVRPAAGADTTKLQQTHQRDGTQQIEIASESFAATLDGLQDAIAVLQTALLMVLDNLVEYSRTHGGTIIEVLDPVATSYGEFDGAQSGTSAGFVSRITFNERSTQ